LATRLELVGHLGVELDALGHREFGVGFGRAFARLVAFGFSASASASASVSSSVVRAFGCFGFGIPLPSPSAASDGLASVVSVSAPVVSAAVVSGARGFVAHLPSCPAMMRAVASGAARRRWPRNLSPAFRSPSRKAVLSGVAGEGEPEDPAPLDQPARDAPAARVAHEPSQVRIFGELRVVGVCLVARLVKVELKIAHRGEDMREPRDQADGGQRRCRWTPR
jgi:hypothetical protein